MPIANVEEDEAAVIPNGGGPTRKRHGLSEVLRAKFATGVGTVVRPIFAGPA